MSEAFVGTDGRIWGDLVILSKGVVRGEERIFIKTPYKLRSVCQKLPSSFWDGGHGVWHSPWSPAFVPILEEAFADCEVQGTDDWHGLRDEHASRVVAQESKTADSLSDLPTKTDGWLHQRRAYHFARDLRGAGLFIEMGGGKSAIAIGLCEEWQVSRVLIMCPKSVMGVWPKQFKEHALRDYDFWVGNTRGTVAVKTKDLHRFLLRPNGGRPKVVIINYDSAWRSAMGGLLQTLEWDLEILDESHKLKSPGGKASSFAKGMQKHCKRILLLTGTPSPHGPGDYYAQVRAVDPGIFGTSFKRHKAEFFKTRPITEHVDKIEGFRDERAETEFTRRLGQIAIVIKKEDMVGAAGKTWSLPHVERQVMLENKTYRHYLEVKNELVTEVSDGLVTADNILVKGLRLRQATSGFLRTEDGIDSIIGTEKRELLAEVLDDIPRSEPVVVFAVFHHDLDVIRDAAEAIGARYGELSGRRRDGLAEDSTLAGDIDVLGCQLQSGGVGIDLTRSSYGIYYSIDYNLGNLEQSFARLDRPGQTRPVTFIHLVAVSPVGSPTVDGVTYNALTKRKRLNEAVHDALRNNEL